MKFFGKSDVGSVRKVNEDSCLVRQIADECIVALVADGMGGHRGGAKASELASMRIFDHLQKNYAKFKRSNPEKFRKILTLAALEANKDIFFLSNSNEEYSGMGTTAVVCLIYEDNYYAVNAGDSRMYVLTDSLKQITKDHSYVRELVDLGLISEDDALDHPNKNVITRALGTEEFVEMDFYTGKINDGDSILLCSDGLSNMVTAEAMEKILRNASSPEEAVNTMIKSANDNGGNDNISVVVITNNEKGGANQ